MPPPQQQQQEQQQQLGPLLDLAAIAAGKKNSFISFHDKFTSSGPWACLAPWAAGPGMAAPGPGGGRGRPGEAGTRGGGRRRGGQGPCWWNGTKKVFFD